MMSLDGPKVELAIIANTLSTELTEVAFYYITFVGYKHIRSFFFFESAFVIYLYTYIRLYVCVCVWDLDFFWGVLKNHYFNRLLTCLKRR